MKTIIITIFTLALLMTMIQSKANAQLTGTKTIPGTYASIKLAIDDLNTNGVGTGGVTFDIAPGYTETIPMGGLIIDITANQPTSGNPVVFQRSGAGTNPLIQTDTNGSGIILTTGFGDRKDAILWLVGTDYITINTIDFAEQYTGGSQTLKTEYGIEMVRKNSTDGCKHVTISGCTIRMQQSDFQSTCIVSINRNLAGNITNPTTIGGRHESISVQGCTLNNSFNGMYFTGYNDSAPYDLYDHFYNIGGITGNTLINIGSRLISNNNASSKYGIYCQFHDSVTVSNNIVRVSTGPSNSPVYGIYLTVGTNSSATIDNNDISDTLGTTFTLNHYAIYAGIGENGTNNTVNITNNTIHDCRYDGASGGVNYYIYIGTNPYTVNVTGNTIRDNYVGNGTSSATGDMYGIYRSSSNTNFGSSYTVSNNTIKNLRRNQSTPGNGKDYIIYVLGGAYNYEVSNNTVDSIFSTTSSSDMAGIVCSYTSPGLTDIHDNTVGNLYKLTSTGGSLMGISTLINNTDSMAVYNNTVFNLYHHAGSGSTIGYYTSSQAATGFGNIYNNVVHDIHATSVYLCMGIYTSSAPGTCRKSFYGNRIYNITNDSTGTSMGINAQFSDIGGSVYSNRVYGISSMKNSVGAAVYGMQIYGISTDSRFDIYNNMVSELYAPLSNWNTGVIGLLVNCVDTTNISYNTIYIDSSSTGSNAGCYALYIAGAKVTFRNNIIINKFTPSDTGSSIGIYKVSSTVYDPASNNNNLYVPAGASNYFYYDGTSLYSTFTAFQTAVSPAETNSFAEDSPFMNVSTHPYDLDMKTTVPTLCDSGAIPIPGITTDIHGTMRNAVAPDVGADEFDGIPPVTSAPVLVYPANNAVLVEVNPLMNWDDVTNATMYHIQLSADSTFGSTLVDTDTLTSSELQLGNNFLAINTKYYWRVSGKNPVGEGPFSSIWNFTTGVTNIEPTSLPVVYELYQNYPNPFNPSTKIKFDIPKAGFVSLKIYDITGREVTTLVNRSLEASRYEVEWNGSRFASGVYFFRIAAGDFVKVQKMILVK